MKNSVPETDRALLFLAGEYTFVLIHKPHKQFQRWPIYTNRAKDFSFSAGFWDRKDPVPLQVHLIIQFQQFQLLLCECMLKVEQFML